MEDKSISCCFTGHRPMKLPWGMNEKDPRCVDLKLELAARLEGIYQMGYRHFICGMALGGGHSLRGPAGQMGCRAAAAL